MMDNVQQRIAVVTGANRGIGLAIARQLSLRGVHVVLTARDTALGDEAVKTLQGQGLPVSFFPLDVTSDESAARLVDHLRSAWGRLDILINNAGVALDPWVSALNVEMSVFMATYETNVFGVMRVSKALIPLMKEHGYGRVVNLSSNLGSLDKMGGLTVAYRSSKTALNALTRVFAAELKDDDILVNAMCPGWVKTALGGADAPRSPDEAADTAVWLATLPAGGPTGGFFQDRKPFPW
jgi:NAD(P)-dependent dehydrogenase (short-subunit alcohol dehydrogenase family)